MPIEPLVSISRVATRRAWTTGLTDTGARTPATVAFTDLQLLDKAIAAKGGFQFDALYHGNTQGYPSHSEADLALCGNLAFWTGCDKMRMDRMFRASGLMRADKWDRQQSGSTYGGITIDRALRDNRDTYYRGGNQ